MVVKRVGMFNAVALAKGKRRSLSGAFAAMALGAMPGIVRAQGKSGFPDKPVRIIVPFPPGGYADLMARMIAAELSSKYAQSVTVDNRPGAGGTIGADAAARAQADGLTLLMGSIGSNAINIHLQKKLGYDPVKSFSPIAFVADAETILVGYPGLEANNVQELIRLAKSKPGRITYASAGSGSTGHLAGELFEDRAGVHLVHIAYRGNSPALNDLMAGQVNISFATLQTALPFVQSGKLKSFAVLGAKRHALLPQVPTMTEAGVKGLDARNWIGLFAPAQTPAPVIQQLNADVAAFLRLPATQEKMSRLALTYIDMSPADFASFVRLETDRWGRVIRSLGITPE